MTKIHLTIVLLLISSNSGLSLFCHKCGEFDAEECKNFDPLSNSTLVECLPGSTCVTYIRDFQLNSESVRGCHLLNGSVPGSILAAEAGVTLNSNPGAEGGVTLNFITAGAATLNSKVSCQVVSLPLAQTGPVTMCTCNHDGCNNMIQLPRAPKHLQENDLTRVPEDDETIINTSDDDKTIIDADSVEFGKRIRSGKELGVQCYSCGSLYRSDVPHCPQFDPNNATQRITCAQGEACLLYMWNKSKTQIGSFRECFSTSIPLGHPDYPVKPMPRCEPVRTQQDKGSSIRACLCTRDYCNNIDAIQSVEENSRNQGFVQAFGLINGKGARVICPSLIVSNADYADCNGEYHRVEEVKVLWDTDRPVYKLVNRDRYIFWNAGGLGWSIGKKEYLTSGAHWHKSGLDTAEPWQGIWDEGVKVKCKEKSGFREAGPVNCVWSSFSSWGKCSASCGKGTQRRSRSELTAAAGGGRECRGDPLQTRSCHSRQCPLDCVWGRFGAWSQCSQKCGGGTRTRRRKKARRERAGGKCRGKQVEEESCNDRPCTGSGDSCCSKIRVSATGKARLDQALYLGVYNKLPDQFNGRSSYRREGDSPLYIYFFHSAKDRLSLWVMGPQLGEFIAGIRNSNSGRCVDKLGSGWKYASRAGVWEDNDPSLHVLCLGGQGTKTTSKADDLFDVIDKVFETTTVAPRQLRQDCVWSSYGVWSECSKSCGSGFKIRVRRVQRQSRGGGNPCSGGSRERKSCNNKSCSATRRLSPTTRRPPTTTRRTTTTTRRTTTTTRRTTTTTRRTTTRRTTTTTRRTTTTTRRTTTTSRSLELSTQRPTSARRKPSSRANRVKCYTCGSLFSTDSPDCVSFNKNDPKQQKMCKTDEACLYYSWTVNGKKSIIRECFPTSILLGTIENPVEAASDCRPVPVESSNIQACICTTDLCTGIGSDSSDTRVSSDTNRVGSEAARAKNNPTRDRSKPARARSDPSRVRCHQCGSLFSENNPACKVFDESDPLQSVYCMPGEACLWYSWQKSAGNPSIIRECFSTSILLGTLSNPLESKDFCEPQDLSDSSVRACLCHSDLCNSHREIRPSSGPVQRGSNGNEVKEIPRGNSLENRKKDGGQFFHPDKIGLQCYACGSLLNRNKECNKFNRTDTSQVQTCLTDEACLMYSWKKSPTERATLRECFPTRVLLGTIDDPLVPGRECSQQDITDNGKGNIFACLCTTDFCNDDQGQGKGRIQTFPPRRTIPGNGASPRRQKFSKTKCPSGFDRIDDACYFFATKRVGWIEAKKLCEDSNSRLLSLETKQKHNSIMNHIATLSARTSEFWLSGNDIDEEQVWEWEKGGKRGPVPGFGWKNQPRRSNRENCLSWTVSSSKRKSANTPPAGWKQAACCRNLRYICEL